MASVAQEPAATGPGGPEGPAQARRALPAGGRSAARIIALREGSIIVVTIVVGDLLLGEHEQLLHRRELRNAAAVLRPVRDPRGGRGVRDDPRRDRPVDRRRCTCSRRSSSTSSTPRSACRSCSSLIGALLVCMAVGAVNGVFVAVVGINSFVATLGMLFTFEGLVADHLPRHAGRDARAGRCPLGTFGKVFGGGHLLGADLGDRDRRAAAGRAHVHALGPLHGRDRLQQARRRRGRRAGEPRDDPQLHAVRAHRRPGRDLRGGPLGRPCSRIRPGRTKSCSSRSRRR